MNPRVVLGLALMLTGCAAGRPTAGGRSAGTTETPTFIVVLRDASPPSQRAVFELDRAWAEGADGAEHRLQVAPTPAEGSVEPRLWLTGALPAGTYNGIGLRIAAADAVGPAGRQRLAVPEEPLRLASPFRVGTGEAVALVAELRATGSADAPGRLTLDLVLAPPPKIATGRIGLSSVGAWGAAVLFDKRSGQIAALLPVGPSPAGLAIDATRQRAYVAVAGTDEVAVLDLLEQRTRERVRLSGGDAPRDLALTPDGRLLLVVNPGSDTVSFVDPIAAVELERVPVAGQPVAVTLDRDGRRAFVVAQRADTVIVLDLTSRSAVGAIPAESGPFLARLAGRSGDVLLIAHADSPYLLAADTGSLAVLRRVYVGTRARALEVDRRSGKIFLARAGTGRIEVFEPSSFLPLDEIPVQGEVRWLAVDPLDNTLGVLVGDPPEVRMLGIVGRATLARTPLGAGPVAIRFLESP